MEKYEKKTKKLYAIYLVLLGLYSIVLVDIKAFLLFLLTGLIFQKIVFKLIEEKKVKIYKLTLMISILFFIFSFSSLIFKTVYINIVFNIFFAFYLYFKYIDTNDKKIISDLIEDYEEKYKKIIKK